MGGREAGRIDDRRGPVTEVDQVRRMAQALVDEGRAHASAISSRQCLNSRSAQAILSSNSLNRRVVMGDRAAKDALSTGSPRSPRRSATGAEPRSSTCSRRANATSRRSRPRSTRASPTRRTTCAPWPRRAGRHPPGWHSHLLPAGLASRSATCGRRCARSPPPTTPSSTRLAAAYLGDRDELEQINRDELAAGCTTAT